MIELKSISTDEWDRFVESRADSLPFHTSAWLNFLARTYQIKWEKLSAWAGDVLVGVIPLMMRRLGPFRLCGSPLMVAIASTPYMAPLADPEWFIPIIESLQPMFYNKHVDHFEVSFPGIIAEPHRLASFGYTLEICQKAGLWLRGRTSEQLWTGMSEACRRAIHKAEANGVSIVECQDGSFIDEYYCMAREVYQGAGREPHLSKTFYQQLWEYLARTGMLKVYLARHGSDTLAGGIFIAYNSVVHYLSGVSYDHAQALRPNNLIQWQLIQWAAGQGYEYYDMGGAVVPGITRFKLSFGGQLEPFLRIYRVNSRLARLARRGYQVTIPTWRRLVWLYKHRFPAS